MKIKRKFLNSIDFKISVVFIMLLMITLEIVGVIFMHQLEKQSILQFKNQSQIQTDVINDISDQLNRGNQNNANYKIKQIINDIDNANIDDIQVVDQKGIIRSTSDADSGNDVGERTTNNSIVDVLNNGKLYQSVFYNKSDKTHYLVAIFPVLINKQGTSNSTLGALYTKYNMQSVYDSIDRLSFLFMMSTISALLIGVILSILVSRTITKPISEIRKKTLKISYGDFSGDIKIHGEDELGLLAEDVNNLSTRIKQSQDEINSEKQRLNSVLEHMADGLIASDRSGKIILSNEKAQDFLKQSEDQLINKPILEILKLDYKYHFDDLIHDNKKVFIEDFSNDQEENLILQLTFDVIDRSSGFISGFVCVMRDVTQQQKSDKDRKQFVSNVSHELRTPLTSIKSYSEALIDGGWQDKEIAPNFLNVIQVESDRMLDMINDLLNLSRMDSGTLKLEKEIINFNVLLKETIDRFDMIVDSDEIEKNYNIEREIPQVDIWMNLDGNKIKQVLDNIINNAIKYSPEGGTIVCRLIKNKRSVIVSVSDNGLGIPRGAVEHIFDRFYRVDKSRSRKQGGSGLGLSISKEIIEKHMGQIWVDSIEGKGTSFFISLPYDESMKRV